MRVWSAGCSSGEEGYSLAILLQEYMESVKQGFLAQVFATDIDPHAIASARAGVYPASIAADITPERLERFFTSEPGGPDTETRTYRIKKNIRDMLIFSEQNVIKDPPFSKLDLISCRNLMIYLSTDLQKKLIPLFHYALKSDGFLFLGTSESVGEFTTMFQSIDQRSKLYQRKNYEYSTRNTSAGGFFTPRPHTEPVPAGHGVKKHPRNKASLRELTEQTLLKQLAPACALVNGHGDIFYLHGRTGMYLEPAVGEVGGYNIIKMAREGLRYELTLTLRKAVQSEGVVRCPKLKVKTNGGFTTVNLTLCPAAAEDDTSLSEQLYLVLLEDVKPADTLQDRHSSPQSGDTADDPDDPNDKSSHISHDSLVASLKDELQRKEEFLQTTIEEQEALNEELKSSNEEMQSVNEELQSSNEELETSKEELQSVNEELSTVNNEMTTKVADLYRANNDMNNLMAGTGIATIFVNHQLQILRFTPTASDLINLIQSDIGRPVTQILTNLSDYDNLPADIQIVLDTLIPRKIEVQTLKKEWYRMNILPYRTLDNVIEGAVITFVDITESKNMQAVLQEQLSEKIILFKETHHRVKNNIAGIESLLYLQAYSSDNPEVKTALQDSITRVQSMRALYDKLLLSNDYRDISIKVYAESLIDSLVKVFSNGKKITIEKQISEFTIPSKNAVSVGMIINEFMTNAFKYAFKNRDHGTVLISIEKTDSVVTLTIHDNGVGIDEKSSSAESPGFGLTIVKTLVDQLGGTYSITNENGTKSVVQFGL